MDINIHNSMWYLMKILTICTPHATIKYITAQLFLRADAELSFLDADTRVRLAQPGAFPTPLVAAVDSDRREILDLQCCLR